MIGRIDISRGVREIHQCRKVCALPVGQQSVLSTRYKFLLYMKPKAECAVFKKSGELIIGKIDILRGVLKTHHCREMIIRPIEHRACVARGHKFSYT